MGRPNPTLHPLVARVAAAETVALDFVGQPLDWGRRDCAQLVHRVLAALGVASPLPSSTSSGWGRKKSRATSSLSTMEGRVTIKFSGAVGLVFKWNDNGNSKTQYCWPASGEKA